ncbi:unnamed protein product [Brugia timori]|uniref:Uncharacterized protein n=1 Tax=Brugia timori TaxID=42155 RepID=A0A0R3RA30_9BILA|nr:unnamed protein product [Brugia timori]
MAIENIILLMLIVMRNFNNTLFYVVINCRHHLLRISTELFPEWKKKKVSSGYQLCCSFLILLKNLTDFFKIKL